MKVSQVFKFNKKIGETPLEAIGRFKGLNENLKDQKITYAGRLDPMAEGEMILLVGEACKEKDKYLSLDKIYEVDILFGIDTDTHDILGLIKDFDDKDIDLYKKGDVNKFVGKFEQKYPMYSSKTLNGKSLFNYAREGIVLEEKDIPVKDVEIYNIDLIEIYKINKEELKGNIINNINLVKGDFRQKEIIFKWLDFFDKTKREYFDILKIKVHCSSGTYMRSLAYSLGLNKKTKAIALSIKREKIII